MKRKLRNCFDPLLAGLLILVLALAGCGGDDGDDGANGADGADGADGQDAVILADVVPLNPVLDLSNTVAYDSGSGAVTIHFFLTDGQGNGVDVFKDPYELRFYASELVPGVADDPITEECEGCTWNQLISERGTPAAGSPTDGTLTLLDADTGEYTYLAEGTVPASGNVNRVTARARWRETIDGTRYVFANPVNASYDFLQADSATELASSGADMVTTEACETCHGARIGDVGHGGGYTQVKTCNNCHNLNYMNGDDHPQEGDLSFMIHRIHAAGMFEELGAQPNRIPPGPPEDFSHVTYPQHLYTCSTCHADDAPNADLAFEVPSAGNCGSCHTDLEINDTFDGVTGVGHGSAGAQSDDDCALCHQPNGGLGGAIIATHDPDPEPANVPEFDVTISMTLPDNGEYYEAGETPVVLVELFEDGVEVASAVYTSDEDGAGAGNVGPGLHEAELFVYGPRADAVPVLTTNSTTDPAWDPATSPTQGLNVLLTGGVSADPQVMTDVNGYAYELMDNIGDLEPGTYMVRFEGLDYGAISDSDYRTASVGLINFQVGTAEEEHKVSGDACVDCHGDTIMHLEGAHPHHTPFDTDQCLGCHDLSENYGDYIGNRVHAVHSASATGDLHMSGGLPRDWSEITFPQDPNNCTICHTDPDPDAPVWRTPDAVACGGCHGAYPEAIPADFPDVDPDQIIQEAAAANHMVLMGGDFDARENPQTQCIVCHGEDRSADLYVTHELVTFPPLEDEDPNE